MKWTIRLKVLLTLLRRISQTHGTAAPITIKGFILQFITGFNKSAYWPVHHSSTVSGAGYIYIGKGTAPGLSHGCYIFADEHSPVFIGDYTLVAPNVCIAGYNHSIYDFRKFDCKGTLRIGNYCWIGMNAVVLPGITLGDHTVVAAGAVVTSSFPEGYVIIGGNPARVLKPIDKLLCVTYRNTYEYRGYLSASEFEEYHKQLVQIK